MKVILSGFNVDIDTLRQLNSGGKALLTPETFSAAYARISRSSKSVTELRRQACKDVAKARKSNKTIIFDMGHHSVAEHAVFNFDIMGISRLCLEELEKFRLASYTEKSQRYVTLEKDYVIPEEFKNKKIITLFQNLINKQFAFYKTAYEKLKQYHLSKCEPTSINQQSIKQIDGAAKEDARYILPLAMQGQVGITINARNLEHLFRRFRMSQRIEVQKLGKKIYELVIKIAPSIILFAEPSPFETKLYNSIHHEFQYINTENLKHLPNNFKIIYFTKDADNIILNALLSHIKGITYNNAAQIISKLPSNKKENIYKTIFDKMQFFDVPPREFELVDVTFQAAISASNFAQLKRHRIATLLPSNYDIDLGNTIPNSIHEIKLTKNFKNLIEDINNAYIKIKQSYGYAADYILTNSHRRLVTMKMNLREIYHFVRLRADITAQWDIRNLANMLTSEVRKISPLASLMLCGKSDMLNSYSVEPK